MAERPGIRWNLAQLRGCEPKTTYDKWIKEGGALLGNQQIGCGLNALTFLGVFTRAQGEYLVSVIDVRGTSFADMMRFVFQSKGIRLTSQCLSVRTAEDIAELERKLITEGALEEGSCTVAKFMRYRDGSPGVPCGGKVYTSGHSVVLSNVGGVLTVIDPQQQTYRAHNGAKALAAWTRNCYTDVCLMGSIEAVPLRTPARVVEQQISVGVPSFPQRIDMNTREEQGDGIVDFPNPTFVPPRIEMNLREEQGEGLVDFPNDRSRSRSRNRSRNRPMSRRYNGPKPKHVYKSRRFTRTT
jgi:hypothetical protein